MRHLGLIAPSLIHVSHLMQCNFVIFFFVFSFTIFSFCVILTSQKYSLSVTVSDFEKKSL
jgi:hypothetical protein